MCTDAAVAFVCPKPSLLLTPCFGVQTGRVANMEITPLALTSAATATQLPVGRQLHQVQYLSCPV